MKAFINLLTSLDSTNNVLAQVEILNGFLNSVQDDEKIAAIALLSGERPKRLLTNDQLKQWVCELAEIPDWLFNETYHQIGDKAQTISHLLPNYTPDRDKDLDYWIRWIEDLRGMTLIDQQRNVESAWQELDAESRFILNKLMTAGFRKTIHNSTICAALAAYSGKGRFEIAYRLSKTKQLSKTTINQLIHSELGPHDLMAPFPFMKAKQIEFSEPQLEKISNWQLERMWEGQRVQFIHQDGIQFIWSEDEELWTDKFPELSRLSFEHDFVIDAHLMCLDESGRFNEENLKLKLKKTKSSRKDTQDSTICLVASDLLVLNGRDLRQERLDERRRALEDLIMQLDNDSISYSASIPIKASGEVGSLLAVSRQHNSSGLIFKAKNSTYEQQHSDDWLYLTAKPMMVYLVLMYAENTNGRNTGKYDVFTFGMYKGDEIVPIVKLRWSLSENDLHLVNQYVVDNTLERFGPVRSVDPALIFEISFTNVASSSRHKSGVTLKNPAMVEWKKELDLKSINSVNELRQLID